MQKNVKKGDIAKKEKESDEKMVKVFQKRRCNNIIYIV